MNKKVISLFLTAALLLTVCGCEKNPSKKDTSDTYSEWIEEIEVSDGESSSSGSAGTGSKGTTSKGNTSTGNKNVDNIGHKGTGKKTVDNLNFGGKTYTKTIVGSVTKGLTRRIAAFEKKYNCKIKLVSLQWEQYNSQVATRMASGDPYDICGLQTTFFPEAVVQGLYEPLEDYIYDADTYNSKTGVGIDMNVSSTFNYGGHVYGVSNHSGAYASMVQVLYYNKVLFEEEGLDDPVELYKKGQWTWDALEKMAAKIAKSGKGVKFLLGRDFGGIPFITSNGHQYTTIDKSGKVKSTLSKSDPTLINALTKLKEFYSSKYVGPKGYSDDPTEFYNGNYYMFQQVYSYGTYYMASSIEKSAAFENDFKNLGVVPYPYGPDNTKKYNPGEGAQAKACGKGSGAQELVIAWTKFEREFEDPMKNEDPYLYDSATQKMIDKLFDNVLDRMPNYKTSTKTALSAYTEAYNAAQSGGEFIQIINDWAPTVQSIIDESLKQK